MVRPRNSRIPALHPREPHERFRIAFLTVLRLSDIVADVVIDGTKPSRIRVPPGYTLHGRQSGERQKVTKRLHANIGIKKNIKPLIRNLLLGGLDIRGDVKHIVNGIADPIETPSFEPDGVIAVTENWSRGNCASNPNIIQATACSPKFLEATPSRIGRPSRLSNELQCGAVHNKSGNAFA